MPRYNVRRPDGLWACFSTVVDDYITEFMPRDKYQRWREKQYGIYAGSIEQANIMSFSEAERIIQFREKENEEAGNEAD